MARLLTQVLGIMSGSIGDIVFKRRGERSYVSAHPSSYTPRTDAATMARKRRFKTSVEIANYLQPMFLFSTFLSQRKVQKEYLTMCSHALVNYQ
jgi:hypothetical protein